VRPNVPSYRRHKPTGQAVVTLGGRDYYLGRHGTAASRAEYDRLVGEWLANGRAAPRGGAGCGGLTVSELILAYLKHADEHYRNADGSRGEEVGNLKDALRPVRKLYGHTDAAAFGPVALKAVRLAMVDSGLARTTVNARVGRVKRMFRWAVASELVPASVYHGLQALDGLRAGRGAARETEPVKPVADEHVDAALPFLSAPVRAMVELQRLTGMRPGEVQGMRPCDLDTSRPVWVYRPSTHKTAHKGKGRFVAIGPRAQEVVRPWMDRAPDAYLFRPVEAAEAKLAERRANRKSPMTPSQSARERKSKPRRAPRERFDRHSYGRAVARACARAGVPPWHPHQLRHAAATAVRAKFGLEAAQVVLGHAKADVTQIYAARDLGKALEVAAAVG
jgi:integrase